MKYLALILVLFVSGCSSIPVIRSAGRWAIRGDVVMDTKNGVYKELFQYTTDEVLNMCELVDFSYILSMLPVPDDEELI